MDGHMNHESGSKTRWARRWVRYQERDERLMAAARHAVLFAGTSAVLTLVWALSERTTTFWPGWVMVLWAPLVTLQTWSAMRPGPTKGAG